MLLLGFQELLALARTNASEEKFIEHVRASRTAYNLTEQELDYLFDLGVSSTAIEEVLRHWRDLQHTASTQYPEETTRPAATVATAPIPPTAAKPPPPAWDAGTSAAPPIRLGGESAPAPTPTDALGAGTAPVAYYGEASTTVQITAPPPERLNVSFFYGNCSGSLPKREAT